MLMKPSVCVRGIRAEIVFALVCLESLFHLWGEALVVTSCTDGDHGEKAFHYNGLAVDIRTHDMRSPSPTLWAGMIQQRLGGAYQVVLEGEGTLNAHIHIEFDDGLEGPFTKTGRLPVGRV